MTQQTANPERQPSREGASQAIPAFKPVALPALAAAMRAAQRRQGGHKTSELPAILRKEAVLGE